MSSCSDGAPDCGQIAGDAAGCVGVHHHHSADFVCLVLAQCLLNGRHINGVAFSVGGALNGNVQAQSLQSPLVRKMARAGNQQGVLG